MKNITIDNSFKILGLNISLGCLLADVVCHKESQEITSLLKLEQERIIKNYDTNSIKEIPAINSTRKAYKAIGKDPSRYRSSAEALYKRIVQGKDLYRINNLVDAGNLISLHSGISLGAYDYDKINGDIIFRIGLKDETYKGIGREYFNLEGLSIFADNIGAFGNPTGDSERTMITENTSKILMILISYNNNQKTLIKTISFAKEILIKTCSAKNLQEKIISL